MEPDFSGYVTKAGLKCSDGRTITAEAFKHQDGTTLPLVWQHTHDSADNVLGHVDLEAREDGIYGYGFFNGTKQGQNGKQLVEHGDITNLSIFANQLVEKVINGSKQVLHGAIREVSLVLAGANPEARIDYVRIAHSDGEIETLNDEAVIYMGEIEHAATSSSKSNSSGSGDGGDQTVQEIYDSLTDIQKNVVHYMIGAALEEAGGSAQHSDLDPGTDAQEIYDGLLDNQKAVVHSMIDAAVEEVKTEIAEHSALNQEGMTTMNVFETQGKDSASLRHAAMLEARKNLTPERIKAIMDDGERLGSLKESFIAHATEYGIEDIDLLFPDATMDGNGITFISRRMEWVQDVLTNTKHSPFSRVKSLSADLTADEARAKGYVKGNLKKDEIIKMLRRITTPKTIYKKQKLDRDDIVDITDVDIVAWLKAEMRLMLDEEIAGAVLMGDGRPADDEDKIDEDHIRPVAYDIDMYTTAVNLAADIAPTDLIDAVVNALNSYKGTGTPTFYTKQATLTSMLLAKDSLGRRLYPTKGDLAAALLVKDIIPVEAMERDSDLVGVIVNLGDYTIGADAGGNVSMFDDFDIDYNQQKYLIETRISGALTKPKAAVALFLNSGRIVTPTEPTFVSSTGVLTIPDQEGVTYVNADTGVAFSTGAQAAIAAGSTVDVEAQPVAGYGFTHDSETEWAFTRDNA
jgi:HK97 family phage prohead protease